MLTAEVLRPAGAARSKGLGCFPTRPLCINKDIACKALCVQKHCLQQSFFTRYARACVVSLNYPTTGVQPEFARVIVSTNSRLRWICGGKPPARAHDFETKSSVLHLARRGVCVSFTVGTLLWVAVKITSCFKVGVVFPDKLFPFQLPCPAFGFPVVQILHGTFLDASAVVPCTKSCATPRPG